MSVGAVSIRGMDATEVVRELWDRIDARDWPGVGKVLADDVVVEWPVTGERIVGRDNFVAVQAEYPEGWSIRVTRIVGAGEDAASEVEVPHRDFGEFRAASFWKVRDGRIVEGCEYWTSPGSDSPPPWRAAYTS